MAVNFYIKKDNMLFSTYEIWSKEKDHFLPPEIEWRSIDDVVSIVAASSYDSLEEAFSDIEKFELTDVNVVQLQFYYSDVTEALC